jgi:hypothetical protein
LHTASKNILLEETAFIPAGGGKQKTGNPAATVLLLGLLNQG